MLSESGQEFLPLLGKAVAKAFVHAYGVQKEFVGPARKLDFSFVQRAAILWARRRVTTLLDVCQRSFIVGDDLVATLQVEVKERAIRLGHEGHALVAVRFEQPLHRLAEALGACALLAAKLVLLLYRENHGRIGYAKRQLAVLTR